MALSTHSAAPTHVETVLVENSDDRLAMVEHAKRTGEPLQSVAANKTEAVPYEVAWQIAEEKGKADTYVGRFGTTHAEWLEEYHEKIKDNDWVAETNEEKAKAHADYSAELVRQQMKDEAKVKAMMAEGYEPSIAVQQANLERANEHEAANAKYEKIRMKRKKEATPVLEMVDEAVEILRAEDLYAKPIDERAKALKAVANVPKADEKATTDALKLKDAIIETKVPYEKEVASHKELREKDRPAISIMESAGSPEELRKKTAAGQLWADNPTEEAAKVATKMQEVAADESLDESTPGDIQNKAEAAVGADKKSDELYKNPKE